MNKKTFLLKGSSVITPSLSTFTEVYSTECIGPVFFERKKGCVSGLLYLSKVLTICKCSKETVYKAVEERIIDEVHINSHRLYYIKDVRFLQQELNAQRFLRVKRIQKLRYSLEKAIVF